MIYHCSSLLTVDLKEEQVVCYVMLTLKVGGGVYFVVHFEFVDHIIYIQWIRILRIPLVESLINSTCVRGPWGRLFIISIVYFYRYKLMELSAI